MLGQIGDRHRQMLLLELHLADRMARCRLVASPQRLISLLIPVLDLALQRFTGSSHAIFFVEGLFNLLTQGSNLAINILA
jgi:hypothetical protein